MICSFFKKKKFGFVLWWFRNLHIACSWFLAARKLETGTSSSSNTRWPSSIKPQICWGVIYLFFFQRNSVIFLFRIYVTVILVPKIFQRLREFLKLIGEHEWYVFFRCCAHYSCSSGKWENTCQSRAKNIWTWLHQIFLDW